ncbi:MAG TPA: trypsin-like peptidase domain-containing protein [Cyclobacteriaceae bacterium]|nr:trypsin-like peptidase domain-containing protein [Cyclobacteriaceae bacterium]HRJ83975.1 trypsin-like peptidase domain-containing protein [Cyclobacteriaceae bacterium]
MIKHLLTILIFAFFSVDSLSQKKYSTEDLSNMVICIGDKVGDRISWVGTATIINDSTKFFLLTASHVSDSLKGECILIFRGDNDKPVFVPLERFTGRIINKWTNHKEADISVVQVLPFDKGSEDRLKQWSFPLKHVLKEKVAIPREMTVIAMGYPILDEVGQHFSPLTFNSFFSSGLLTLRRGDTRTQAVFQLLENPSVQGYSGGPVFIGIEKAGVTVGWNQTTIVGIVHGTFRDNTGGKLAMITPAYYIHEIVK